MAVSKEIEILEGVVVEVKGKEVTIKSGDKENKRNFKAKHVTIEKKGDKIVVATPSMKKDDLADVGTVSGHIGNMMRGVKDGITYKMKVVYSHFPMNVKFENNVFYINNFLGEKTPRITDIPAGVSVDIQGQDITLSGINKELVGQTAAQIEQKCSVRNLDRRIFQDGIYITEKDGKPIK